MKEQKSTIQNIDVSLLHGFLTDSIYNGDQTLDIRGKMFYCKTSNKTKSHIVYRELFLNDDCELDKNFPEHLKFFIQDYQLLSQIVGNMRGETKLRMVFHHIDGECHKISFFNKYINFSINSSELGLSDYIPDDKFDSIRNPQEVFSEFEITSSVIKEIKSLHGLSKSDNEKLNVIKIGQGLDKITIGHDSVRGKWGIELESTNHIQFGEFYFLPLEFFNKLGNKSKFTVRIVGLGGVKACFINSIEGSEYINITRIELNEF